MIFTVLIGTVFFVVSICIIWDNVSIEDNYMSRIHEPCGCTHNGTAWLSMCQQHNTEQQAHNEMIRREWNKEIPIKVLRKNGRIVPLQDTTVVDNIAEPAVADKQHDSVPKRISPPESGSKLEQALQLYTTLTDRSRKNTIQVFIDKLGFSANTASTYENKVKKLVAQG